MFNKDNIISVRYTNPENDTIEVIYTEEDGRNIPFFLPTSPTSVPAWKILKEAGWTPSKIADATVEWIKEQSALQFQIAERFATDISNKQILEIRERYDARVLDMSSSINNSNTNSSSLYKLINDLDQDEESVFKFKLDLLEDASNFEGLSKTAEKTKRREIRKCKTVKELINFII